MEYFSEWLMIAGLMIMVVMAPGPDFVMAVRNSMTYSRKAGIFTAFGFGLGICVHTGYCIFGIALLISQSILAFNIIKYIGAAYLVYMGIKALRSNGVSEKDNESIERSRDIHWSKALGMGFLTNLLNPKATMFFFALFTQVIDPHTPLNVQIIFSATCAIITVAWFSFVAFVLTSGPVRRRFLAFSKWIDRLCGGAMIALGLRLAMAKSTA